MLESSQKPNSSEAEELREALIVLVEAVRRLEAWTRILAQPVLLDSLPEIFENPAQLRAYELSDGSRSTREIGALIGVTKTTVSNWCLKWEREFKILERTGNQGRFQKIYSLVDLVALYGSSKSKLEKSQIESTKNTAVDD